MIEHFSTRIQNAIQTELFSAKSSIQIAVAWFTNNLLFQPLLMKLALGVKVTIILNKDEINCSSDNEIDFNAFISAGGELHWNDTKQLMHDKFCIIDNSIIIFGSYNWTNKAEYNDESITIARNEPNTLLFYNNRFKELSIKFPTSNIKLKETSINFQRIKEEDLQHKNNRNEEISVEKKNQQAELARIEKEREEVEKKRIAEEQRKKEEELESNEKCYTDVPLSKRSSQLDWAYPVWDNGLRIIPELKQLRYSSQFFKDYPDNLTVYYYGASIANDPNLDPSKENGIPCLKFKTGDGKLRFFITIDDLNFEESIIVNNSHKFLKETKDKFDGQTASEYALYDCSLSTGLETPLYYNNEQVIWPEIESFQKKFKTTVRSFRILYNSIKVLADEEKDVTVSRINQISNKEESFNVKAYIYKPKGDLDSMVQRLNRISGWTKKDVFERIKREIERKKKIILRRKELFQTQKMNMRRVFSRKAKFSCLNDTYDEYKNIIRGNLFAEQIMKDSLRSLTLGTFPRVTQENFSSQKINIISEEEWKVERGKLKDEFNKSKFEDKWDVKTEFSFEYKKFIPFYLIELFVI